MPIRELSDVNITHVSYVLRGANKKKFLLTKSETNENPDFEKKINVIVNKNDEKQLVYGVVYEPDEVDAHGDYMTSTEIEKAAHKFLSDARNIDTEHDFNAGVGEVVESYIAPEDFEISGEKIKKGTWLLVTKASDEIWKSIKNGDITGYSMAGLATVTEIEKEDQVSKGFAEVIAEKIGGLLMKGLTKDVYEQKLSRSNALLAMQALEQAVYEAQDIEEVRVAARDFQHIVENLSYEELQKSRDEKEEENKGDIEVKKEDLEVVIKETLQKEFEKFKAQEDAEAKVEEVVEKTNEDEKVADAEERVAKMIEEAVAKAVEPLEKELTSLKNSTGISKSLDDEKLAKQSEEDIFSTLFGGN